MMGKRIKSCKPMKTSRPFYCDKIKATVVIVRILSAKIEKAVTN